MKIVCTVNSNRLIVGLASALSTIEGMNVVYWSPQVKNAIDMCDEIQPDMILCETSEVDPTLRMALESYPQIQVVLFGIAAGNIKPAIVCFSNNIPKAHMNMIVQDKFKAIQIQNAANVAQFYRGEHNPAYASDVLYISDEQLIAESFGVLLDIGRKHRLRVIGPSRINIPQYVGGGSLGAVCSTIRSARVGLDFTGNFMYDFAINKVPCLSPIQSDVSIMLTSGLDISKYLYEDKLRKKLAKQAYDITANGHTFYHRIDELFSELGQPEVGQKALAKLESILNV